MTEKTRILLATALGKGNGMGHLKRSMRLLMDDEIEISFADGVIENAASFDLVVTDLRKTDIEVLSKYEKYGPVVGLDEGGKARRYFPFLIDSLQIQRGMNKPNLFLDPLENFERENDKTGINIKRNGKIMSNKARILISFGGEDPMNLTAILIEAIDREGLLNLYDFTVVVGPLFNEKNKKKIMQFPVHIMTGIKELLPYMKDFDLVITSYGNTPYEAIASGVPVILFNPTAYHKWLGRKFGFTDIGVKNPAIKKLKRFINRVPIEKDKIYSNQMTRIKSRIALIKKHTNQQEGQIRKKYFCDLNYIGNMSCPVCTKLNKSIARFSDRTYFQCKSCGIIYQVYLGAGKTEYDKNYFFRDYKEQYGKTYLEDFDNLKEIGKVRLDVIEDIIGSSSASLSILDVGCALGAFLLVARDRGYDVTGLDISHEAVDYVKDRLGIKAYNIDFSDFEDGKFNIITMWYVIEHFVNLDAILRKVNKHLPLGGVFAFSTPNGNGISARKDMVDFLKNSPKDHFTIFTPVAAKKVLARYGFSISKTRITGHHYERFPLSKMFPRKMVKKLLEKTSRLFGLGDTFEVYAVKEREV